MPECVRTFDGHHHYAPRKPPWKTSTCVCGKRPPNEVEIRELLAKTEVERERQMVLSKRLLEQDDRQGKLAL